MPQSTMAAANTTNVGVFNPVNQLQQLGNMQPMQSLPPMPQFPNGINDSVNGNYFALINNEYL